ncbi:unnamed protein product, partial [marine sediment metagenome]
YPLAGEFVGDALYVAKGRKRPSKMTERVIDNFSLVGGMGIATSMYQAAQYDQLARQLIGPTGGDATQLAEGLVDLITTGKIDQIASQVSRQPAFQLGKRMVDATAMGAEALIGLSAPSGPSSNNPATLSDMIRRGKGITTQ